MANGVDPRSLLSEFGVDQEQIPQYVDDLTLWKLIINMIAEPPRRNKLRHVNTLDDVVRLLKGASILFIVGWGCIVSVFRCAKYYRAHWRRRFCIMWHSGLPFT